MSTSMGGATGMKASSGLTGGNIIPKGMQRGQLSQFTPEQMQLFQSLFGQLGPESFLGKLAGGDQGAFEQMEAPALRQFGALQGNMASRFSGMGSGARRSSGFQQAGNQAASDFAGQLQSNRMGIQQQALRDLMTMSGELLGQRPYEQFLTEKPQSFLQQMMLGLGGGLAQGFGGAFGGGAFNSLFGQGAKPAGQAQTSPGKYANFGGGFNG